MRILKAKEKKERALGTSLGLKAHRSSSPKSALVRRGTRPGMHGAKRQRMGSEYKQQLQEKQKIKFSYGLTERQMVKLVRAALQSKRSTSDEIMRSLESRLDNVVYRLGLAGSRIMARQMVTHGHIFVNGRKVNIPSFVVGKGDTVTIKEKSKTSPLFKDLSTVLKSHTPPEWLLLKADILEGVAGEVPEHIESPFNINLVIDYYSR